MSERVFKNKEEWRTFWLECYQNRYVDSNGVPIPVDVGPGSYPWVRASAMADVLSMQSGTAAAMGEAHLLDNLVGDALDKKYGSKIPRNLFSRSLGSAAIETASAGTLILAGDTLVHGATGNRYRFTGAESTEFQHLDSVALESIDSGVGQDLAPGSVLTWETPRAGCYATCKVIDAGNGRGLYGGADRETDEAYRERIRYFNANPAGGGNEGELMVLLEESSPNEILGRPGHGVPVEQGFVYPAIHGPGTCGLAFTVKSDTWFGSRNPTSAQLTTVIAYVSQYASARDMLFFAAIADTPLFVDVGVELNEAATRWGDRVPWPAFRTPFDGQFVIQSAVDASNFTIYCANNNYSGAVGPSVDRTIAVFDKSHGVFRKKKIKAITGTGPWVISCYTDFGYSDTSYTPIAEQKISPWFDAINDVLAAFGGALAKFGPGEMTPHNPGDGKRMRRIPLPTPDEWPTKITGRVGYQVETAVPSVNALEILYTNIDHPWDGSSIAVRVLAIDDIGVFKS